MHRDTETGFTLVEVLVAVAVLALALAVLSKGAAQNAANGAYLRDRTLASWVAANQLNELLLQETWPAIGESTDRAEMASREWLWEATVEKTPDDDVRRVEIEVRASASDKEAPIARLAGFVSNPRLKQRQTAQP